MTQTKPRPPLPSLGKRGAVSHPSETDTFAQRLYTIIAAIPYGHVTTYGALARLAGSPRAARQVGGVLRHLPKDTSLPWHRVINHRGKISLTGHAFLLQKHKRQEEGIAFCEDDSIDLKTFGWNIHSA